MVRRGELVIPDAKQATGSSVCICVLAIGRPVYHRAARQCVQSILAMTPFEVVVVHDRPDHRWLPRSPRVLTTRLPQLPASHVRAAPFLRKFEALRACLAATSAPLLIQLDADAIIVGRIGTADIEGALGEAELAAVEQLTIVRTGWTRVELREHYIRHALAWLAPEAEAPPLEEFRFFNSGVVLGRRDAWQRLVSWATATIAGVAPEHHVGEHMITDQDYFQFWANTLHHGTVRTLSWEWNHCEHWDEGFPREGALVAHFSTFCLGPGRRQAIRMWALRQATRGGRRPRGLLRWVVAGPLARMYQ